MSPNNDPDVTAGKHRGSETSAEAHATTSDHTRHRQKESLYRQIRAYGPVGRTADELVVELGIPLQTVSARVSELLRDRQVEDSGHRRKTRTGKSARVLVACIR